MVENQNKNDDEPELRPEFVEKILNLEKNGKFYHYENFDELVLSKL